MPSVTYNGQSFALDGRRFWILGASLQYARIPPQLWRARIAAARQAGFNTIETAAVWSLHEPRRGRFVFGDQADIRKFIEAAGAEGMKVVLRVGPYVGHGLDAGGIPGWLMDSAGTPPSPDDDDPSAIAVRENNELFLEHVSRYFRRLLGEVSDLQATGTGGGGPILLLQAEHAWTCSNPGQGERYLHEVTRFIRESGIAVPIINANDLWQESPGTIDTWRGYDHLLFHLRQLRTLQAAAPRMVSEFMLSRLESWGEGMKGSKPRGGKGGAADASVEHSPQAMLQRLAEVLAAGAQPIVAPFHNGTNFGFLGGRGSGGPANFLTTAPAIDAPLGEAGERGEHYALVKRLIMFANHFAGAFTELDPDYQPIALDPHEALEGATSRSGASVLSLRGSQGRVVFAFAKPGMQPVTLVLDNGLRLPVTLGDQPVTWTVLDADLQGAGRLDYSNVCPWAVVDRSIAVFHGPAKSPALLSIDGIPMETSVPAEGAKPVLVEHHGLTVVILNRAQIDATYHNAQSVYVGIAGFTVQGQPIASPDWAKPWVISAGGRIEPLAIVPVRKAAARRESLAIGPWQALPATAHITGASPRFASLDGPATLSDCGAPMGYGWYRMKFNAGGRTRIMLPHAADRLHLYLNGRLLRLVGVGPGSKPGAFEVSFEKGAQTLVALADNLGRFCEGNDLGRRSGLFGHIYAVKEIRAKAKITTGKAVSAFALRAFIEGRAANQLSDVRQAVWTFDHPRKTPLIIEVFGATTSGVFVLNDKPVAYYAGATGGCEDRIVISPDDGKALKRGRNVLRFAPDHGAGAAEELSQRATLYEAVDNLTENAEWSFAKWEPPGQTKGTEKREGKHAPGTPCWWKASVRIEPAIAASDRPLWLETTGLSKGQAFINGSNLGRFFTATADRRAVGPQKRLFVPTPWLKGAPGGESTAKAGKTGSASRDSDNEILIFDEHGFEPPRVRLSVV